MEKIIELQRAVDELEKKYNQLAIIKRINDDEKRLFSELYSDYTALKMERLRLKEKNKRLKERVSYYKSMLVDEDK